MSTNTLDSSLQINDKRLQKEFGGITFSKFKKTDVKNKLSQALMSKKIEEACYWCAELVCAGHLLELWEFIIVFFSKNIHVGSPKLPIYLNMRLESFKRIVNNGFIGREIKMRNNMKVRELFAEIMSVLCFSRKMHNYGTTKVSKDDFDLTNIQYHLTAPNVSYVEPIFMKDDPKEIFIALNELAYCLSKDSLNTHKACYWVEWILEYDMICRKKKIKCLCQRRTNIPVDPKDQTDIVWLIWEVFLQVSTRRSTIVRKILRSLLQLFCLKFTHGVKKRRKNILYFVISMLTTNLDYTIPIIENQLLIKDVTSKINSIYKQVKQNELKPDTDYLFHGINDMSNEEKTNKKLDIMNGLDFIPRS